MSHKDSLDESHHARVDIKHGASSVSYQLLDKLSYTMSSAAIVIFMCVVSVGYSATGLPSQLKDKDRRVLSVPRPGFVAEVVTFPPKPYQFGYELEDGFGMSQYRSEASDGAGVVKGSYGYMDPMGVYRKVEYTADNNGYRAVIRSNEPGTANQDVADALYIVEQPPAAAIKQGFQRDISPRDTKS